VLEPALLPVVPLLLLEPVPLLEPDEPLEPLDPRILVPAPAPPACEASTS